MARMRMDRLWKYDAAHGSRLPHGTRYENYSIHCSDYRWGTIYLDSGRWISFDSTCFQATRLFMSGMGNGQAGMIYIKVPKWSHCLRSQMLSCFEQRKGWREKVPPKVPNRDSSVRVTIQFHHRRPLQVWVWIFRWISRRQITCM